MKDKIKYILIIGLICILMVLGIFLPQWITVYTDNNIIGKVKFEPIKTQEITTGTDTSIIKKMKLLKGYPQKVNRVMLERGVYFDLDSASIKFFEEVEELTKLGLLPKVEQGDKTTLTIDVSLYIQKDSPDFNGVLWNIVLREDKFLENFYMDDSTGKIIQYFVTGVDEPLNIDRYAIEIWAEYLGLKAQKIELQPEPYFKEDKFSKIFYVDGRVYNFEFLLEDNILPYTFYNFNSGYGFGYIEKLLSNPYDNILIRTRLDK